MNAIHFAFTALITGSSSSSKSEKILYKKNSEKNKRIQSVKLKSFFKNILKSCSSIIYPIMFWHFSTEKQKTEKRHYRTLEKNSLLFVSPLICSDLFPVHRFHLVQNVGRNPRLRHIVNKIVMIRIVKIQNRKSKLNTTTNSLSVSFYFSLVDSFKAVRRLYLVGK